MTFRSEDARVITGGVDTHAGTHVAAALDPLGGLLGVRGFAATAAGYADLLSWLSGFGTVALAGVEGTGSYGAGLARHLAAVGTLVERTSRYLMLLHLPDGRDARLVEQAMQQAITALPAELARTITGDQGIEMAYHADFTIATGIPVYFCDPHAPWQRGSNENTNGLLRQYLPKGTDLSVHSAGDLARIAASLNNRPRKTLGFMKPSEKLTELLAHTG